MVKGTSSMALGGPPLVKAVVGEEISEEDLGGSKVHNEVSGVADLEVENDAACIEAVKEYLSFFPTSNAEKPPRAEFSGDARALLDEKLLAIVPDNPRQGYDMKKLIRAVVDDGKLFEMKPKFAKNLITGFARVGGYAVGIVANNPMFLGGALDVNSADKAARFVWLCDAFNIPLLFMADTPGFLIGSKMEQAGIIRHGAKMLYAVSDATVPKITVVVRKSYGAGYYVMCGRAYDPDMLVAWPTAEISVMGAEGMAGIATKKLEGGDPAQLEAAKKAIVETVKPLINIYKVAGWGLVDDVIDPRETRAKVFTALELTRNKTVERPARKHGVLPV
jgi:acetyl-CoA carboxylase carboxyltransferase component